MANDMTTQSYFDIPQGSFPAGAQRSRDEDEIFGTVERENDDDEYVDPVIDGTDIPDRRGSIYPDVRSRNPPIRCMLISHS
jgi:hypothetical protein